MLIKKFGVIELNEEQYKNIYASTPVAPFVVTDKWVSILTTKNERYWLRTFSTYMQVSEKILNIDTGIVTTVLEYFNGVGIAYHEFDSSIFSKFGAKLLLNYGIRFSENDVENVTRYLVLSDGRANVTKMYSKLGWNQSVFRSNVAVGCGGNLSERYNGNLTLTPHGNLSSWLDMVKDEVVGNTPLTYVLLLGFASPILSFLNQKYDLGSILFNLSNTSSKGKTTSAMLATSIFSNPVMNQGFLISYNATENALIEFISSSQGHTIALDEVAISNIKDFQRFMYVICNGRSKMRLNCDSTAKAVKIFDSFIISTAEFDVISEDSPKGLQARVFQINDNLTVSAENSDNIKQCVIENYAVAGSTFIRYVIQNELYNIQDDYEKFKKLLIKKCKNTEDLTERIFSKLAVVLVTAQYVQDSFDINLQIDKLIEYTLKIESNISVRKTSEENLLEIVQQEVLRNYTKYILDGKKPQVQCFGAVVEDTDYIEFQITESALKNILGRL